MESLNSEEIGVKPTKADRKKFDLDLQYGGKFVALVDFVVEMN